MIETRREDVAGRPVAHGRGRPIAADSQTPQSDAIDHPAPQGEAQSIGAPSEALPLSTQTPSPQATSSSPRPRTTSPSLQDRASQEPTVEPPARRRPPVSTTNQPLETIGSIESPPLKKAAAKNIPWPKPSGSPGEPGIPAIPVSRRGRFAEASPSADAQGMTGGLQPDARDSASPTRVKPRASPQPPEPFSAPMHAEPQALHQGRTSVKSPADTTGGDSGRVHIGSLEIRIIPAQPTQPRPQTPPPVRSAPAVPSKSISRTFPTFGLAQAY